MISEYIFYVHTVITVFFFFSKILKPYTVEIGRKKYCETLIFLLIIYLIIKEKSIFILISYTLFRIKEDFLY